MKNSSDATRVGLVGTGFIAQGALEVINSTFGLRVASILTRRRPETVPAAFPAELVTNGIDELIDGSDLIFECTGDVIWATSVIERALAAGRPVVTMNSEFHVTIGSYFVGRGYLTEACGDQPGALAALHREALGMGFVPMALVNIKGFLNLNPSEADMRYWSELQGLSLHETTSFTDGTKLQIEQAFIANGLGADIIREGMLGRRVEDLRDTDYLIDHAESTGNIVSDYVLCNGAPPGVFILAKHPVNQRLPNYGPYEKLLTKEKRAYLLLRPYHLCALEVANTLRQVVAGDSVLLDNGVTPRLSVAAVAKQPLPRGHEIRRAIGGFEVRGVAVRITDEPDHVPIGLLDGARLRHAVEPGQALRSQDVELSPSRAVEIWGILREHVLSQSATAPLGLEVPGFERPSPA